MSSPLPSGCRQAASSVSLSPPLPTEVTYFTNSAPALVPCQQSTPILLHGTSHLADLSKNCTLVTGHNVIAVLSRKGVTCMVTPFEGICLLFGRGKGKSRDSLFRKEKHLEKFSAILYSAQQVVDNVLLSANQRAMALLQIRYCFRLPGGECETFVIELDATSLDLQSDREGNLPAWTALDYHQCTNCTLDSDEHPCCPLAACLAGIVGRFAHLLSFDTVMLEVRTAEREVSQTTTVQRAIASYMGLVIATSGCPNTMFLRPMARFHLPLASEEETIYRAFSMYGLAQFFIYQEKTRADFSFKGLEGRYKNLLIVNQSIVARLRAASTNDSSVNALLNLDVYARAMPYVVEDSLEELRYLFSYYLDP